MANSIDTRLTELADRLDKAETELRKQRGINEALKARIKRLEPTEEDKDK